MRKMLVAVGMLIVLVGCNMSPETKSFLREKSAEIGSKDVLMFDIRRRAVEVLIAECLAQSDVSVDDKLACVELSLEIVPYE